LYSIASSPKLIGAQSLELIVTDVEWSAWDPKTGDAKKQTGLCTGFLREMSGFLGSYQASYFDRMGMFPAQIHESPLEPPTDPMLPLITIALGSGYAPFRSIL
jgi:sulfite reductase alpha subunit-like flavoprotein